MKEAKLLFTLLIIFSLFAVISFAQAPPPSPAPPTFIPEAPVLPCTSFTYSGWGACSSSGTQTRTILTSSPSGCTDGDPVLSQSCTYTAPSSSPSGGTTSGGGGGGGHGGSGLCTNSSWTSILAPTICPSTSKQTKTWIKTGTCTGGVTHPAKENVTCTYIAPATAPAAASCTESDWSSIISPTICPSISFQTKTWVKTGTCSGGVSHATETVSCTYSEPSSTTLETPQITPSSNMMFYILSGIFLILFIIAALIIISKLKKKKASVQAPVNAFRSQQQIPQVQQMPQQINPQILQLKNYISDNLAKGYTKEQIGTFLMQNGYPREMIDEAMKYAA